MYSEVQVEQVRTCLEEPGLCTGGGYFGPTQKGEQTQGMYMGTIAGTVHRAWVGLGPVQGLPCGQTDTTENISFATALTDGKNNLLSY